MSTITISKGWWTDLAKYTYQCLDDMHEQNVRHTMKDNPTIICEKCGAGMIKMLPKNITIAANPMDILGDMADENLSNYKQRNK